MDRQRTCARGLFETVEALELGFDGEAREGNQGRSGKSHGNKSRGLESGVLPLLCLVLGFRGVEVFMRVAGPEGGQPKVVKQQRLNRLTCPTQQSGRP